MKKFIPIFIPSAILALFLLLINWLIFREIPNIFFAINMIAGLLFVLPITIIKYIEHKKKKEIEEMFPVFLRDFVEAVRGGLVIPQAFKSVSRNDYKSLTPYVKKISEQLDWGISVDKVLTKFAKEVKSELIGRVVTSVIESHRFGGNLADTFEALANTATEIKRLRAERRTYLQSQLITGYIIFFVFLGVMIALEKFLVPGLARTSVPGGVSEAVQQKVLEEYKAVFRNLILIQGFFAGLSVGKMAEGAMVAGLKHSMFMMLVGTLVFVFFA
jgi:flagellar protein FlaJ